MKPAFEQWLINNFRDRNEMANELIRMIMDNPNADNMVWAMLEKTGDTEINRETFLKVADAVLLAPEK